MKPRIELKLLKDKKILLPKIYSFEQVRAILEAKDREILKMIEEAKEMLIEPKDYQVIQDLIDKISEVGK